MAFPLVSDTHDCRSCYKCIRVCPTKSISFQEGRARIVPDGCILCGACYLACPQEAKKVRDDKAKALSLIQEGNAYCSLAPSYLSAFPGTGYPALREALLSIGFKDVEETAVGATIVKRLYDQETEKGERRCRMMQNRGNWMHKTPQSMKIVETVETRIVLKRMEPTKSRIALPPQWWKRRNRYVRNVRRNRFVWTLCKEESR